MIASKWRTRVPNRRITDRFERVVLAVACITLALSSESATSHPVGDADEVYIVTHIDIVPTRVPGSTIDQFVAAVESSTKEAIDLLRQLAATCQKEARCNAFDVVQQIDASNHFTVIEQWATVEAYGAHKGDRKVKEIRIKLQPLLGSPLDERIHHRAF